MITRDKLEILKSTGIFISPKEAGIPFNDIRETLELDGKILSCDLVVRGTNRFVYWDKQYKPGKMVGYPLREKQMVLYSGRVDLDTGEVLSTKWNIPFDLEELHKGGMDNDYSIINLTYPLKAFHIAEVQ